MAKPSRAKQAKSKRKGGLGRAKLHSGGRAQGGEGGSAASGRTAGGAGSSIAGVATGDSDDLETIRATSDPPDHRGRGTGIKDKPR
jgi:hypothetical protein